jgi:pSer/pThr/pTyr-binding forkhead associated (FHA) protein
MPLPFCHLHFLEDILNFSSPVATIVRYHLAGTPVQRCLLMGIQLVVASGSRAGQVVPIVGERFVVGRADDCHLKPRSELISRYHCEIFTKDGGVFVRDMGSKNGVFLNEEQITETQELTNGDKLVIGPLEFFVHIAAETNSQSQEAEVKPAPQKIPKVRSVSDAVARTVALQSGDSKKNQEDSIADWLLAAGESGDELETRTIDASELMTHLHTQSEETASREKEGQEESEVQSGSGVKPGSSASSRDAASDLLRKFFKGGK